MKRLETTLNELDSSVRRAITELRAANTQVSRVVQRITGTLREERDRALEEAAVLVENSDAGDGVRLARNIRNLKT
jgi:hypothetical protein